jgi:NDP-sugar pyrophosphorylase family protein
MLPLVLLAGGLATRMRPLTEKIPKSMLEVKRKPFIDWQLRLLKSKGIENVIICLGYLGGQIEKCAGNGGRFGLKITYSYDGDKLLGTGGAVKKIDKALPSRFFILYGDSYLDIDYKAVEEAFTASGKPALMTVYKNNGQFDASNVIFRDGRIVSYSKKEKLPEMEYIDYGLGIIQKNVFDSYPANTAFDLAEVYEKLCREGRLAGYEVFKRFYEIGSPQGLKELESTLKEI